MDPIPLTELNAKKGPELFRESISLDQKTAKALGRGLRQQVFKSTVLDNMCLKAKELRGIEEVDQAWINFISTSVETIRDTLENLETAKEVRLVIRQINHPSTDQKWEFYFPDKEKEDTEALDEERERPKIPEESDILIDKNLSAKLESAISHHFGNPFVSIRGFAELIQTRSGKIEAKKIASDILSSYNEVNSSFEQLRKGENEILLETDSNGDTKII